MYEINDVFFHTSVKDKMAYIAQSRLHKQEQQLREQVNSMIVLPLLPEDQKCLVWMLAFHLV